MSPMLDVAATTIHLGIRLRYLNIYVICIICFLKSKINLGLS